MFLIFDDIVGLTEDHWQGRCAGGKEESTIMKESLDWGGGEGAGLCQHLGPELRNSKVWLMNP